MFVEEQFSDGIMYQMIQLNFSRVKYQTKPDFSPPKLCNTGQNYAELKMNNLLFDTMRAAVKLSFDNVKDGNWMGKNAEYCLQKKGIDSMLT